MMCFIWPSIMIEYGAVTRWDAALTVAGLAIRPQGVVGRDRIAHEAL